MPGDPDPDRTRQIPLKNRDALDQPAELSGQIRPSVAGVCAHDRRQLAQSVAVAGQSCGVERDIVDRGWRAGEGGSGGIEFAAARIVFRGEAIGMANAAGHEGDQPPDLGIQPRDGLFQFGPSGGFASGIFPAGLVVGVDVELQQQRLVISVPVWASSTRGDPLTPAGAPA
ncbi:hypothetical protein [Pseudogemmobacter humi]|uniref:hypothetical protein n=1 Tax=Pseudogemmobacter humi TaxID=2483812 RepID=UPI000F521D9D|nr:hypothetical protein [Pseudogemmobacter humi]